MPGIKWTVGMAVYDDGTEFEATRCRLTAMSLSIHSNFVGEVLVVDNNPKPFSPLKAFLKKVKNCRYVEMPTPVGTSAPRNLVFQEAANEYVACVDSHVLLYPGFFEALSSMYAKLGLDCPDLFHGPMMTEAGKVLATHMNDKWRAHMLGTWGLAWMSPTGRAFSCHQKKQDDNDPKEEGVVEYLTLGQEEGEQRPLAPEEARGYKLPEDVPWFGHEHKVLLPAGCSLIRDPIPVPGHGMGFFACRKDAWLPFHPAARGFGAEEITTGYRFRQNGRKVWTVPGCKWWHDFEKAPGGVSYPLRVSDRVRNYILEFCRLGLDLTPVQEHFQNAVPAHEWPALLRGEHPDAPTRGPSRLTPEEFEPASLSD